MQLASTKSCNNSKNAYPVSILETTKTINKYIANNLAGVVQHGLLARPCGPLRVLFISLRSSNLSYSQQSISLPCSSVPP